MLLLLVLSVAAPLLGVFVLSHTAPIGQKSQSQPGSSIHSDVDHLLSWHNELKAEAEDVDTEDSSSTPRPLL